MKKLKLLLLFFTLLFPLTACGQLFVDQTQSGSVAHAADVVAQYNAWYRTPASCPNSNPTSAWLHWAWWSENNNPCNFIGGTSWLRDSTTIAYPLIGPYKSNLKEVFRWQIRAAKAAGIEAFLASTFPGSNSEKDEFIANTLILLEVAAEENFKVGLQTWMPLGTTTDFYKNLQNQIDQITKSPHSSATFKVNGKLLVWVHFWSRWDSLANLTSNLLNAKQAFWLIEGDLTISEMNSVMNSVTNGSELTTLASYNYPTTNGCNFLSDVSDAIANYQANGYKGITRGFPGFNEALMTNDPGRNPPRYCLRNNGALLNSFLEESTAADVVIVESWNDFGEMTMIEPGLDLHAWRNVGQEAVYSGDPYKVLKQIAAWKGVQWKTPILPCEIVDPFLVSNDIVQCGTPTPTPPNAPSALALK